MSEPIPLRPPPRRLGACPAGHGPLDVEALHLAGWRSLVRGRCPACGHAFLQDLPAGHGLLHPCSLDLATGATHGAGAPAWFADPLRAYYERPDADPVAVDVDRRRGGEGPAVLLGCLDVTYGAALRKLLNAGRHRDERCIALVPEALHPLVPDHVDEAWVVRAPIARLRSWLLDLDCWVGERLDAFAGAVALSPAVPYPHPSTYRLADHRAGTGPPGVEEPRIVLALDGDRPWGRGARAEQENVARFARRMRATFPRARLTAVGAATPGGDAVDEDLRSVRPDGPRERDWIAALTSADLVVGIGGRGGLLAAALGPATIALLAEGRDGDPLAGALVGERDPLAALSAHRTLYGNRHLSDVDGARAGGVAAQLLAERARFAETMLGVPAAVEDARGAASGTADVAGAPAVAQRPHGAPPAALARAAPVVRARADRARSIARTAALLGRRELCRLRARRLPAPIILTDARGARFELLDRGEVAAFLEHDGHFEAAELDLLARYLRPGDTALDVGANLGHFTATMARAVAPGGVVHAFEPLASNRARLARTLDLNDVAGSVHVEPAAVAARAGSIELVDYGEGYGSWATTKPAEHDLRGERTSAGTAITVPAVTLDEHCRRHGIEHVAALKVDVEGAELDVLDGAEELLAGDRTDLLVVECSDSTLAAAGRSSWELVERLGRGSLRTYALAGGRLEPHRSTGWTDFSNVIALSPAGRRRLGL